MGSAGEPVDQQGSLHEEETKRSREAPAVLGGGRVMASGQKQQFVVFLFFPDLREVSPARSELGAK